MRCQRLAKTTRQMLSDKDQRELVLDLYRTDATKVEGLTNKGIYGVLETVGRYPAGEDCRIGCYRRNRTTAILPVMTTVGGTPSAGMR